MRPETNLYCDVEMRPQTKALFSKLRRFPGESGYIVCPLGHYGPILAVGVITDGVVVISLPQCEDESDQEFAERVDNDESLVSGLEAGRGIYQVGLCDVPYERLLEWGWAALESDVTKKTTEDTYSKVIAILNVTFANGGLKKAGRDPVIEASVAWARDGRLQHDAPPVPPDVPPPVKATGEEMGSADMAGVSRQPDPHDDTDTPALVALAGVVAEPPHEETPSPAAERVDDGAEVAHQQAQEARASIDSSGREVVPPSSDEEINELCETVEDVVRCIVGYLEIKVAETPIIIDDLFSPVGLLPALMAHAVVMWSPISMGGQGRLGILLRTNPDAMLGYSLEGVVAEPKGAVSVAVGELTRRMIEGDHAALMPTIAIFRLCLSRLGGNHSIADILVGKERVKALSESEVMAAEEGRGSYV